MSEHKLVYIKPRRVSVQEYSCRQIVVMVIVLICKDEFI